MTSIAVAQRKVECAHSHPGTGTFGKHTPGSLPGALGWRGTVELTVFSFVSALPCERHDGCPEFPPGTELREEPRWERKAGL